MKTIRPSPPKSEEVGDDRRLRRSSAGSRHRCNSPAALPIYTARRCGDNVTTVNAERWADRRKRERKPIITTPASSADWAHRAVDP
jgi:hypothetical protein